MNTTQPSQPVSFQEKGALVVQPQKLAYAAPVLQVYGSVARLTQGAGSVGSDGLNATKGDGKSGPSSM